MQTILPAPTQIFAKPAEAETTTKSGFILSERSADKPHIAEVINVGRDVKNYKSKETIVYKIYATSEIKLNGDKYILIDEQDVLGTVLDVEE